MLKTIYNWFIRKSFNLPSSVILEDPLPGDALYEVVFEIGATKAESRNWKEYRPEFERQGITGDCVSFSRTSAGEYKNNEAGQPTINFSDLELAVGSKTTLKGNNLNRPSEYFRKTGVVKQEFCDYDADMLNNPKGTWWKRQQKVNAIPDIAKKYKGGNHSWVITRKDVMIDALQHSPLQIAVGLDRRWNQGGVIPRSDNPVVYHAIVLEHIDNQGRYHIFDSQTQESKILASDYKINQVKSFRDLPVLWKDKKKALPIFYKAKNSPAIWLYGIGSGKFYLIPSGKIFKDLFGEYAESTIVCLGIITLFQYTHRYLVRSAEL